MPLFHYLDDGRLLVGAQPHLAPIANLRFGDGSTNPNEDVVLLRRFGNGTHRDVAYAGKLTDRSLELARIHVESVAREHRLQNTEEGDRAIHVAEPFVAGAQPVATPREAVRRIAEVARRDVLAADADLAWRAVRQRCRATGIVDLVRSRVLGRSHDRDVDAGKWEAERAAHVG